MATGHSTRSERRRRRPASRSRSIPLGTGTWTSSDVTARSRSRFDDVRFTSRGDGRSPAIDRCGSRWPPHGRRRRPSAELANVGSVGMSGAVAHAPTGRLSKAMGGKATFFYALILGVSRVEEHRGHRDLRRGRASRAHASTHGRRNGVWRWRWRDDAGARRGASTTVLRCRADRRRVEDRLHHDRAEDRCKGRLRQAPEGRSGANGPRSRSISDERLPIEVEGEPVGTTPATFEVVPSPAGPRA